MKQWDPLVAKRTNWLKNLKQFIVLLLKIFQCFELNKATVHITLDKWAISRPCFSWGNRPHRKMTKEVFRSTLKCYDRSFSTNPNADYYQYFMHLCQDGMEEYLNVSSVSEYELWMNWIPIWRRVNFLNGCMVCGDMKNNYKVENPKKRSGRSCPAFSLLSNLFTVTRIKWGKPYKRIKIRCTVDRRNFVVLMTEILLWF